MKEYIEKSFTKDHLQLESDCGYVKTMEDVFKVIDALPAADVVERKRGEWKPIGQIVRTPYIPNYFCTVCGARPIQIGNFCPNCGADLRGEKHEAD